MTAAGSAPDRATVVGAGIVGVCTALWLQRAGFEVMILDPNPPGEGASAGNAGNIATWMAAPLIVPRVLMRAPAMLLDPLSPLSIRWRQLPRTLPWLWRLVRASTPKRLEAISVALKALHDQALETYAPLIEGADVEGLLVRRRHAVIYESEATFAAASRTFALCRRREIAVEEVDGDEMRRVEPALGPTVVRARLMPETTSITDPLDFTRALAADFERRGGTVLSEAVLDFEIGADGPERIVTDAGSRPCGTVVIAAGAYSGPLAARLGSPVPLAVERGYHVTLADPGVRLRTTLSSADGGFAIVQMGGALRLAGTVEFAAVDAPPNYARAEVMLSRARRLLPGLGEDGATRWMGPRPSLPDTLPVIGRSPRHGRVFFAFGHGHLGMTLAAVTGRLIAAEAAGRSAEPDLSPYRVDRF